MAKAKIKVWGKKNNRTVLGIANAFLIMNPDATIADFKKAFPVSLNPAVEKKYDSIFEDIKNSKDTKKYPEEGWTSFDALFFAKPEDQIKLQDGSKICVMKYWKTEALAEFPKYAKKYDIEVADGEPPEPYTKAGWMVKLLDGYRPPESKKEKTSKPESKNELKITAQLTMKQVQQEFTKKYPYLGINIHPDTERGKSQIKPFSSDMVIGNATKKSKVGDVTITGNKRACNMEKDFEKEYGFYTKLAIRVGKENFFMGDDSYLLEKTLSELNEFVQDNYDAEKYSY